MSVQSKLLTLFKTFKQEILTIKAAFDRLVFIYLRGRARVREEGETETESSAISCFTLQKPSRTRGWARPKPAAQNTIQVFPHRWQIPKYLSLHQVPPLGGMQTGGQFENATTGRRIRLSNRECRVPSIRRTAQRLCLNLILTRSQHEKQDGVI